MLDLVRNSYCWFSQAKDHFKSKSYFLPDLRHLSARLCREGLRHSVCNATEVAVHNDLRLCPRRRVLPRHCAIYRTYLSIFLPDLRHLGARLCREGLCHSVCNATEVTVHNDLRLRSRRRILPRHCAIYRTGQSGSTETNTW